MIKSILDFLTASLIFFSFIFGFSLITANYFGGFFQSFIVATVIFGTCFLIVAFYIIFKRGK
tara:strand:+ start:184 stop:369 length:186 start_codon:yes stop_codon:yes gene_type:complete